MWAMWETEKRGITLKKIYFDVGCGDDTYIHTNIATDQTQRKSYFTSRIINLTLLRGLDWFESKISGFQ